MAFKSLVGKCASLAVALSAAVASATNYTWTGGGDGTTWSDPANWGQSAAINWTTADTALFSKDATVSVDQTFKFNTLKVTGTTTVTLTNGGGMIQFGGSANEGLLPNDAASTIIVSVPIEIVQGRKEHAGNGTVKFLNGSYKGNGATDSYNRAKTQIYSTGAVVDLTKPTGTIGFSLGVDDTTITFEQDAQITLKGGGAIYTGSSGARNTTVYQKDEASVSVAGDFYINVGGETAEKVFLYYLQGGTLTTAKQLIPNGKYGCESEFHQTGGTANLGGLDLKNSGKVFVEGGEMSITGTVLCAGGRLEVCGGTLNFKSDATVSGTFYWDGGESTLNVETGANLSAATLALTKGYWSQAQIDGFKANYGVKAVTFVEKAALDSDYVWLGDGDGKSWSDPANWGLEAGAPYPGQASVSSNCNVIIGQSANIVFDVDEEIFVRRIFLQGANLDVSLMRKEGCSGSINFAHGYDGYASGFTGDSDTSRLTTDVTVRNAQRADVDKIHLVYKGEFHADAKWYIHGKSNVFADGSSVIGTSSPSFGMGSDMDFRFERGATIDIPVFQPGEGSYGSDNNWYMQDGATMNVTTFYANYAAHGSFGADGLAHGRLHYILSDGELNVASDLNVTGTDLRGAVSNKKQDGKGAGSGEFVQKGGTTTTKNITLNYGDLDLQGGVLNVSGVIAQGVNPQGVPGTFTVSGGTLALGATSSVRVPIHVTGGTIALASGVSFSGAGVLDLSGATDFITFKIDADKAWSALSARDASKVGLVADTPVTVTTDGSLPPFVEVGANVTLRVAATAHADGCTIRRNGGTVEVADGANLSGATLTVNEKGVVYDLAAIQELKDSLGVGKVLLDGPTFKLEKDYDWATLRAIFFDDVNLVADAARVVTVSAEAAMPKALTVGKNVTVKTDRNVDFVPDGSGAIPTLTINDGGCFGLDSQSSHLSVPVHLAINGTGYFDFSVRDHARGGIVAYSYTLDGKVQAIGQKYRAKIGTGPIRAKVDTCEVIVPFIWTGKGDGKTISDRGNWQDGNWSSWASAAAFDFSQAKDGTVINVDQDDTFAGICYLPAKAGSKVSFSGKKMTLKCTANYFPLAVCRKGCTLDVGTDCCLTVADGITRCFGLVGGGTFRFGKKLENVTADNEGTLMVDGVVEIAGTISGNYLNWSYNHNQQGAWYFKDGANVSLAYALVNDVSGFLNGNGYTQDGGAIKAEALGVGSQRDDGQQLYTLNGGSVTLAQQLIIGAALPGDWHHAGTKFIAKGTFTMNGGSLSAKGVAIRCNSNYCRLLGGDVTLGADGFKKADGAVASEAPNTTAPIVLGNVTLHANTSWAVDPALVSDAYPTVELLGLATLDIAAGQTVTLNGRIVGGGGLLVTGAGTLALAGDCTAKGGLTLGSGATVALPEGMVCPTVLRVESADALKTVTVTGSQKIRNLFIGGVRQPLGSTHEIANGTLEIALGDGVSTWTGNGGDGKWATAANWSPEVVPNGADAKVDLEGASVLAITLNEAVTLKSIRLASDVTLLGTSGLSLAAGGTIDIDEGATLTVKVPVTLPGSAENAVSVEKAGYGTAVFDGAVSGGAKGNSEIVVTEGAADFGGTLSRVLVRGFGVDADAWPVITLKEGCTVENTAEATPARGHLKCYGKLVQDGAQVFHNDKNGDDLNLMSVNGGEGLYVINGGTLDVSGRRLCFHYSSDAAECGTMTIIQNGGVVTATSVIVFRQYIDGTDRFNNRYVLNGGTLNSYVSGAPNDKPEWNYREYSRFEVNGGTINVGREKMVAEATAVYTTICGEVTIANDSTGVACLSSSASAIEIDPATKITFVGAGTLDCSNLGSAFVGPWLVTGGTLLLGDDQLDEGSSLSIKKGAKVGLAFEGVKTIDKLYLNGRLRTKDRTFGYGQAGAAYFAETEPAGALINASGAERPGELIVIR